MLYFRAWLHDPGNLPKKYYLGNLKIFSGGGPIHARVPIHAHP